MDNILSYAAFLKNRSDFRRSGTRTGSEFNIYDTPSHKFFKILFYFWNEDTDGAINHSGGLLAPTWEIYDAYKSFFQDKQHVYYNFDSAWAYLKNNAEDERAEKLEQFVTLLSNINSESPWYFSEISGLSEALNRSVSPELKVEEERKKISIKCLPDAFDNRIETLLSLYRDITWSWVNKREIIPANLRKFDMGIYIWESPVEKLTSDSYLDDNTSNYSSSYKLLELHNCEIDYNSLKSGYETLTNKEGFTNEFTIDIMFDDCYEHTYNSIMIRTIGDVIEWDTTQVIYDDDSSNINYEWDYNKLLKNENERGLQLSERVYNKKGFVGNLLEQVGNKVVGDVKSAMNKLLLGNLYTYSVSRMADQLKSAMNGDVFSIMNTVDEYAGTNIMSGMHNYSLGRVMNDAQQKLNRKVHDRREGGSNSTTLGSMGKSNEPKPYARKPYTNSQYDRTEPSTQMGDIFPTIQKENVKTLGNLNKARTLINNI